MTAGRRIGTSIVSIGCLLATLSGDLSASEGGVSVYQPGFFSSMAGAMPGPGAYGDFQSLLYGGDVEDAFLEDQVVFNVDSDMLVGMFAFTYVTKQQLFGADFGFSVLAAYARVDVSATLGIFDSSVRENSTETGPGDVTLTPVMLGWHRGSWHQVAMLDVYVPVGTYDVDKLATTGLNREAIEPVYAVTYFDEARGREFSATLGYIFNFENDETQYDSGDEFHVDLAAARWLASGWSFGGVGYWLKQVTGDSGEGALLGSNKGEVFGLGPIVSYSRELASGKELMFSARYYREFGASNRLEGDAFWLRASISF